MSCNPKLQICLSFVDLKQNILLALRKEPNCHGWQCISKNEVRMLRTRTRMLSNIRTKHINVRYYCILEIWLKISRCNRRKLTLRKIQLIWWWRLLPKKCLRVVDTCPIWTPYEGSEMVSFSLLAWRRRLFELDGISSPMESFTFSEIQVYSLVWVLICKYCVTKTRSFLLWKEREGTLLYLSCIANSRNN